MKITQRYIFMTRRNGDTYTVKVSPQDYDVLAQYRWSYHNAGYAVRKDGGKMMLMHRQVLSGVKEVDHVNRDRLDNRRENLRPCSRQLNNGNMRSRGGASKYKGVSLNKKRWAAACCKEHLGTFDTQEEAARAYDVAALRHFGEYARLNFPNGKTTPSIARER